MENELKITKERLDKLSLDELLELSLKTFNISEQKVLMNNHSTNVRRNLALNKNVSREVINYLAYDTTINVIFCAINHPNCTEKRIIDSDDLRKCVICDVDMLYLKCKKC